MHAFEQAHVQTDRIILISDDMATLNTDIKDGFAVADDFDLSFKVFHELMLHRVSEILLVSSPYDAFIMEEDGRIAERIIHEYRGLNLTRPPRITWASSSQQAVDILSEKKIDLVITAPRLDDADPYALCKDIKKKYGGIPVYLLAHDTARYLFDSESQKQAFIDKFYIWRGNTDLLLAIIKNVEDQMNVAHDTQRAKVRVIILVEDSPIFRSSLLPLLYKEVVLQTQAVMEDSLNEEHRILRMRARPKILVAENFEEAQRLYREYKPYLLSVLTDVRFKREGKLDDTAGFKLLDMVKKGSPGMPVLVLSSDEHNREKAENIPSVFINKNSATLHTDIRDFLIQYLAFGDFIFRLPDGREIGRASNLREMEKVLPEIPESSITYHAERNHFSTWLMARSEIQLASKLRPVVPDDFSSANEMKEYLIESLQKRRWGRQKGIITDFIKDEFDPDADFVKIGKGSLGGKARGLAFMSTLFKRNPAFMNMFPEVTISVPRTLVISTEGFDAFVSENNLGGLANSDLSDRQIIQRFLEATLPKWISEPLELYLKTITVPIAVRSSSLLEDARFQPYAGIYRTYMVPNSHPDLSVRFSRLARAIKLVYASTYLEIPRSFARSTQHRIEEEKMGVVIQQVVGTRYDGYFFPPVSGVAQSYNFYPISYMKPDEGIAHIAFGLGKTVVEGGRSLRFSPRYPQFLPQFSTVDDVLKNVQRSFYALNMTEFEDDFGLPDETESDTTLTLLEIDGMAATITRSPSVRNLFSTYIPDDHKIKDSFFKHGHPLLTFASVLKYNSFPLSAILSGILEMGRRGMGSPVEIEFAVNFPEGQNVDGKTEKPEFALLQIRPMVVRQQNMDVRIKTSEIKRAVCFSTSAMGNGIISDMRDIVYVQYDTFDTSRTLDIAAEIARINNDLLEKNRKYILIGPGRWGSADRFLGIPVTWGDISGVGAMIETTIDKLQAEPSQGTHFFHNITSLGITYITVKNNDRDFINETWLNSQKAAAATQHVKHIELKKPVTIKIDGKQSWAVILT